MLSLWAWIVAENHVEKYKLISTIKLEESVCNLMPQILLILTVFLQKNKECSHLGATQVTGILR